MYKYGWDNGDDWVNYVGGQSFSCYLVGNICE